MNPEHAALHAPGSYGFTYNTTKGHNARPAGPTPKITCQLHATLESRKVATLRSYCSESQNKTCETHSS